VESTVPNSSSSLSGEDDHLERKHSDSDAHVWTFYIATLFNNFTFYTLWTFSSPKTIVYVYLQGNGFGFSKY
jgi:hypothetical protein